MNLKRIEFVIYDRYYLDVMLDEDNDELYYSVDDINLIFGFDVKNLIKKEHILPSEYYDRFKLDGEMFINQKGFDTLSFKFSKFFKNWFYKTYVDPI